MCKLGTWKIDVLNAEVLSLKTLGLVGIEDHV